MLPGMVPVVRAPKYFINIIKGLGLAANLKLCLDARDPASYVSGQSWLDRAGGGYDFFLGADGSATATDPTFTGTAGSLSAYWAFDGGDYFTYDTTNEAWMQNIHKDNAKWGAFFWVYLASTTGDPALAGTRSNSNSNIGFRINVAAGTGDRLLLLISNGSGTVSMNSTTNGATTDIPGTGQWFFVAVSVDEAVGAGGGFIQANLSASTFTSTYGSPSASAATYTMQLGAAGNATEPMTNGSRMAGAVMFEGVAPTQAQATDFFNATRGQFGV